MTMLSEAELEAAHPESFDYIMGVLDPPGAETFQRHMAQCRYCRAVVDEYGELGQMIQAIPPALSPSPDLQERTVAAMVRAIADQRPTQGYPTVRKVPAPSDAQEPSATEAGSIPATPPPPAAAGELGEEAAKVIPFHRRLNRRVLTIAAAAAAVIAVAIVVPLALSSSAPVTVVIPLHATTTAAVLGEGGAGGQATAHQAGPSWTFVLNVHGLKPLPGNDIYECWWAAPASTSLHPMLVSGGTFVVGDSGATTLTMTAGVDPHQFRMMEVTAETPGSGAQLGHVILIGTARLG
jgi:Anti-sigma-K factor rskA